MDPRRTISGWTVLAPAKLNLHLRVLGKRPDGYHEVETLIAPIACYDTMHLAAAEPEIGVSLRVIDPAGRPFEGVPTDHRNLVCRALELLRERWRVDRGARVLLIKRIPTQAGMGGGSSDAAAALMAGVRAWGLDLSPQELQTLGAEIGSDVPALLNAGPTLCTGRGERVRPVDLPALPCVVVRPPVGLGTREVYDRWSDTESRSGRYQHDAWGVIEPLRRGDLRKAGAQMFNALQRAAASLSPWIERTLLRLAELGLSAPRMSGSGSACFALAPSHAAARRACLALRAQRAGWVLNTTLLSRRF